LWDRVPLAVDVDATDRIMLVNAVRALSSRQRQAVVLRYVVGLSEADTAQTMGLSPGMVKTHVQRGLAALRLWFGNVGEETRRA
jgi:RNA polymerase sigma factor (sigma-70 family)